MLYKLIHDEPIRDIKIGRYSCLSKEAVLTNTDEQTHKCKTAESYYQNADDADAHYSSDGSNNTAKTYPLDRRGSEDTTLCCEEEGRQIPSVSLSHYLPEKVLIFGANDVKSEYSCKASDEAVPKNPYSHFHNTNVPPAAYSTFPPTAVVTTEEPTQRNCSKHTATVIPITGNNEYSSSQVSDTKYFTQTKSADPQILMGSYAKHPSKDLFNPHKYLHIMEQDSGTCMQSPHLTPWQYQQLPQQHEQLPPWQCQQEPQQYQYLLPSQLLLQPQGSSRPKEREEVVVVSPYFSNLPNPKADTTCPVPLPIQPNSHDSPHPSTSSFPSFLPQTSPAPEFLHQTWDKSSRPSASNNTSSNAIGSALILGNTHQVHQEALPYEHQLCPDKVFDIVKPNQWNDDTRTSEPTSHHSQQGQGPPSIYDFQRNVGAVRPGHNTSEDAQRLFYEKVPGWGAQTKLVINSS